MDTHFLLTDTRIHTALNSMPAEPVTFEPPKSETGPNEPREEEAFFAVCSQIHTKDAHARGALCRPLQTNIT